jgi:hypothetical protein
MVHGDWTVVKIMKDVDRKCKYSDADGDVEDLLLDDLVQLAKLDPANNVVVPSYQSVDFEEDDDDEQIVGFGDPPLTLIKL